MHMGTANVSTGARAEEVSKAFHHMATLGAKPTQAQLEKHRMGLAAGPCCAQRQGVTLVQVTGRVGVKRKGVFLYIYINRGNI